MPTFLGQTVTDAEYAALKAHYEEIAFQRKASQGQLCAPMVISDTQPGLMSMTNGQMYDSKSEMRKEYKRAGVVEVGNDVPTKKAKPTYMERAAEKKKRQAALGRALSRTGFGA